MALWELTEEPEAPLLTISHLPPTPRPRLIRMYFMPKVNGPFSSRLPLGISYSCGHFIVMGWGNVITSVAQQKLSLSAKKEEEVLGMKHRSVRN